ncbi:MAG: glycosyltransferase [Synergistaceae bacterium]|nr:glycosyltransferase [Synergistaceae bacterium]MBQ3448388.1 glycosyltransferase [Synergistaceae bacterium]MBQ3694575.1 glycosyltransferase [Synergistaceae bacterium]MBQ6111926.1 glycosyltransferase [Synergistaceae bacterium]MBQ9627954.1 glycosyltransferase [Synergistaceae bacterium]
MKSVLAAITTCKRKPEMLERAIKSVAAQTYTDWDLVVVDDSPADYEFRDDVRKMVEEWSRRDSRIRYVAHDKNYGAPRARNTALKIASDGRYKFIAYLDDDDEWLPEKLEKQIAKFSECDENTALVYCRGFRADRSGDYIDFRKFREGYVYPELFETDFIGTFTAPLIRTECINVIGGFDEEMIAHQDYDTWIRLAERYNIMFTDEKLFCKHNEHKEEQISKDLYKYVLMFERILKKHERYLSGHKNVYRLALYNLSYRCTRAGDWQKCFDSLKKALVLQPLKCTATIKKYLIYAMMKNTPDLLNSLVRIKQKLKGEKIN